MMKKPRFVEKISFQKISSLFLQRIQKGIYMGIIKQLAILSTVAALAAAVSCDKNDEWQTPNPGREGRIAVRIAAPATRTAIDENTLATRWVKGDRMALWAYANGAAAFENVPFTLWYPRESPDEGLFTGMVDAMEAGTYDYYASYPTPEAVAGTKVSYTIPAVQSGAWNPALDIMLAATQGAELREEILNEVTLHFYHKVHALKITIPEGRNLLGKPIRRLRIDFPQPVAGRMTWNLAAPEAAPEMQDATNAITIDFAEPADAGDTFWVFLAPADLTGGEVKFTAFCDAEMSHPLSGRLADCSAGRITPIGLTIGESLGRVTWFEFSVDDYSKLGEPVIKLQLALPDGATFATGEQTLNMEPNGDGKFQYCLRTDDLPALAGKPIVATYESESAVVSDTRNPVFIPDAYVADGHNPVALAAPYLFFEDFSETTDFDHNGSSNSSHDTNTAWADAANLAGWSGNQYHLIGGKGAGIRHRTEKFVLTGTYRGRMDSKQMTGLKPEASVKVRVNFDYSGSTTNSKHIPVFSYGYTTRTDALAGYYEGGSAAIKGGDKLDNTAGSVECPVDGSIDAVNQHISFDIDDCTQAHRLSWDCSSNASGNGSSSQWAYLDNIRVTIVH